MVEWGWGAGGGGGGGDTTEKFHSDVSGGFFELPYHVRWKQSLDSRIWTVAQN